MTPPGAASRREERVYRALARIPRGPILALARAGHHVMQARQLRGIRRRAEAHRPAPQRDAGERAGAAGTRTTGLPRLVRADNGMNIVGQGGRIMLATAPALAAAVIAHLNAPALVRIPLPASVLAPIGVALAAPGLALWLTAVVQLLVGFPRGKLVTTGAYGVCRNPIYSSMALLVLPGVSLMTGTWAYLVPAAVLLLAVLAFIRREERDLLRVFGDEYRRYSARVHRVLPFVRPARSSA